MRPLFVAAARIRAGASEVLGGMVVRDNGPRCSRLSHLRNAAVATQSGSELTKETLCQERGRP